MKARINGRSQTKDMPPPKKKEWEFFFQSPNTHRESNSAYYGLGLRAAKHEGWGGEALASENWEEKVGKRNKMHVTTFLPLTWELSSFRGTLQRPTSLPTHEFTHPQTHYKPQIGNTPGNPLAPHSYLSTEKPSWSKGSPDCI